LPTRNARNGQLFTNEGIINIGNSRYKHDISPIDENSNITFAKEYSKSYLRYLFQINEILGIRIATLINIAYYFDLMNQIKFEINNHTFVKWSEDYLEKYENSK
jgi:queuine tRNA-ribosyltransferase